MSPVDVRLATVQDAEGIAMVKVRGWQSAYRGLIQDAYLDAMDVAHYTHRTRDLLERSKQSQNWVCCEGTETIGWASVRFFKDEKKLGAMSAQLEALYILEAYWNLGVGFLMWQTVLSDLIAQKVDAVSLWLLEGNHRALKFYERQGFVLDGQTKAERMIPGPELRQNGMLLNLSTVQRD